MMDEELRAEIKAALEGDSNDAEHDALAAVASAFGIEYRDPDDVLYDDEEEGEAIERSTAIPDESPPPQPIPPDYWETAG